MKGKVKIGMLVIVGIVILMGCYHKKSDYSSESNVKLESNQTPAIYPENQEQANVLKDFPDLFESVDEQLYCLHRPTTALIPRILAADAARPRAARAAGRLFTLVAKHLLIHRKFLRSFHASVPAYRERTSPLVASTTTCQGIILPLCCKARLTAFSIPPQQGTSMRTTVTLWMSFCRRISVSFSA